MSNKKENNATDGMYQLMHQLTQTLNTADNYVGKINDRLASLEERIDDLKIVSKLDNSNENLNHTLDETKKYYEKLGCTVLDIESSISDTDTLIHNNMSALNESISDFKDTMPLINNLSESAIQLKEKLKSVNGIDDLTKTIDNVYHILENINQSGEKINYLNSSYDNLLNELQSYMHTISDTARLVVDTHDDIKSFFEKLNAENNQSKVALNKLVAERETFIEEIHKTECIIKDRCIEIKKCLDFIEKLSEANNNIYAAHESNLKKMLDRHNKNSEMILDKINDYNELVDNKLNEHNDLVDKKFDDMWEKINKKQTALTYMFIFVGILQIITIAVIVRSH